MSTRAVAPIVGASQSTIRDDTQVSSFYSPEPRAVHSQEAQAGRAQEALVLVD